MAGNTQSTIQENQTFTTGVVPIVVGVLNPANSPNSVWDCGVGMLYAAITTAIAGTPTSFTIVLEGTYDGATWSTLATTTNTSGETLFVTALTPFTNLRARCTAVSGGSSPTVNVYATAFQTAPINITGSAAPNQVVQIQGANGSSVNADSSSALRVSDGSTTATSSLAAVTTGNGTAIDFGSACQSVTFQLTTSGTITGGSVTFSGSVDNATFIVLTAAAVVGQTGSPTLTNGVLTVTTTTTALVGTGSTNLACRYFRADVTSNITGGGNVTVKVMAF